MKPTLSATRYRQFPHVVSRGSRRDHRARMVVSNGPAPATSARKDYVFEGAGLVDEDGDLTPLGRRTIVTRMSELARTSRALYCVVWSAGECTWFESDGCHRDSCDPPRGFVTDPWIGGRHDVEMERCDVFPLPADAGWSHLCVRRLDRDLVEIAPGEPLVLADFDEPEIPGLPDPAAGLLYPDGTLRVPGVYRGQLVTGVRDDWKLLGPVQPADEGAILRNPWPDEVRQACERIAEIPLPRAIVDAVWTAIHPDTPDVTRVALLRAA